MIKHVSHVMTLANSVIGVSVLAMPFCFKQCGIVLAILMLLVSSILSKFACHFLVKSAIMSRRYNFEFLAFHAFGRTGKFLAELFIIGFLMGTCIAFFVVVGDLGPEIVGKIINKSSEDIRTSLLVTIGVFIILPLGLLRNIDSLSTICTATIGFYLCLVLKVMTESMAHIFATDWYDKVFYWRPSGILQCLPIFSMALFCQTQLFEIYEVMPNVCLEKMNRVVRVALNICTIVYVCVGFFGYVAFCTLPLTGNVLMSFEPSFSSDVIKIGFVLSVAFSFPLVIFPCRASLNSLLFRWAHVSETSSNYIPETRFKCLTFMIVVVSLITGILMPNIEVVLGIVGSTIGVITCLMFPAAFFISISSKNTNERLLAQGMLFVGIWIMILGTYANLYAMEESANVKLALTPADSLSQLNQIPINLIDEHNLQVAPPLPKINEVPNIEDAEFKPLEVANIPENVGVKDDIRQEPPIPVERAVATEKVIVETVKSGGYLIPTLSPVIQEIVEEIKKLDQSIKENTVEVKDDNNYVDKNAASKENLADEPKDVKKMEDMEIKEKKPVALNNNENLINSDAIKKEESELAADAKLAAASEDVMREELKKTLEKHKIEQRQMLNEQLKIINSLKQQQQERENEKKENMASKKDKMQHLEHKDNRDTNPDKSVVVVVPEKNNLSVRDPNSNSKANDKTVNLTGTIQNKLEDTENNRQEKREKDERPIIIESSKDKAVINSPGPVLSALTKQGSNNSKANNGLTNTNGDTNLRKNGDIEPAGLSILERKEANRLNNDAHTVRNNNKKLSVPIALVMSEKMKKGNVNAQPILPKAPEETIAIRRDILENSDRKKREIDRKAADGSPVLIDDRDKDSLESDKLRSFINEIARTEFDQECSKTDESSKTTVYKEATNQKKSANAEKTTTELLLIKTNSYLSDGEIMNGNSFDKSFNLKVEFDKVDQRDVKPVGSKNGESK